MRQVVKDPMKSLDELEAQGRIKKSKRVAGAMASGIVIDQGDDPTTAKVMKALASIRSVEVTPAEVDAWVSQQSKAKDADTQILPSERSTSETSQASTEGGGVETLTPEEIEAIKECRGFDLNDLGNAQRLKVWAKEDVVYVVSGPGFHVWNGTCYQQDPGDLQVRALALKLPDRIKQEADYLEPSAAQRAVMDRADEALKKPEGTRTSADKLAIVEADEVRKKLSETRSQRKKFATSTGNAARTGALMTQFSALYHELPEAMDSDERKLNVANGTLRFSKIEDLDCPDPDAVRYVGQVELQPHSRADKITRTAEVTYDPEAECPRFLAFLNRVQPGTEMQRFLQVATGYAALIGGNDEQCLFYHYGKGANGKSAFIETTGRLLGKYRAVTSPDSLVGTGQRQGNQQNSDMARLYKVRLVTVEELPRGEPLKENLIKQLTGGSRFVARFLNKDFFEFDPTFTAVMSGNDMPTIGGMDDGIWRRLLIVPWRVQIPEEERLPFGELLAAFDQERSGILNWLIEGALLWLSHGLHAHTPAEVREFTNKHREDRDVLGNFIDAYVERDPEGRVQAKALLDAFTAYCEQNGIKPWHQATVGAAMKTMGFEKEQGRHVHYKGLRLIDPPSRFDPQEAYPAPPYSRGRGEP